MRVLHLLSWLLALGLLAFGGTMLYRQMPCRTPIAYSMGRVDERFHITPREFTDDARVATQLWSDAGGRKLFTVVATGGLAVSAIYDQRQEARDTMESINAQLDRSKEGYDILAVRYQEKRSIYDALVRQHDTLRARYDAALRMYDDDVAAVRERGTTPDDTARLERERRAVNAVVDELRAQSTVLRAAADAVNGIVDQLRAVAADQQKSVDAFEQVGLTIGDEFEAGFYEQSQTGKRINVFAFQNGAELTRLLAHEFGHALGLGHLDDPSAVMYRLNQKGPAALSAADVAAIRERCSLTGAWKQWTDSWARIFGGV